jgi:hypothetical protein
MEVNCTNLADPSVRNPWTDKQTIPFFYYKPGNTKGRSINVPLTSCLTGLDLSVLQIKSKIVICHTADSKPVKEEVNGTVILPPLVFHVYTFEMIIFRKRHRSRTREASPGTNVKNLFCHNYIFCTT